MWARTIYLGLLSVLFVNFATGETGNIYDVTTIYDVSDLCYPDDCSELINEGNIGKDVKGRVHSRTNSRGLPLYHQHNNYSVSVPKTSQYLNFTLDTNKNVSNWNVKDWKLGDEQKSTKKGQMYPVRPSGNLQIKFKSLGSYGAYAPSVYLYFTFNKSRVEYQDNFYILQFQKDYYSYSSKFYFYSRCHILPPNNLTGYSYILKNIPFENGTTFSAGCEKQHISYELQSGDLFRFNFSGGRIKSYKTRSNSESLLMDNPDDSREVNYFTVVASTQSDFDLVSPLIQLKAYSSNVEGSHMVSSLILPSRFSPLCLTLVLYSPNDTSDIGLNILAEDLFHTEYQLRSIGNVKAGWSVIHSNFTLQASIVSPIKLIINKTNSMEVKINMISSCSEEVDLFEAKIFPWMAFRMKSSEPPIPVFSVHHDFLNLAETTPDENSTCLNGGVMTSAGCACLPGFAGPQCRLGCGKNRFGQDCGGLCSDRLQECEGRMLCTSLTNCHCAPGYTGYDCKSKCSDGSYGNDCSQMCGNCSSGICDIYTGKCARCKPGYVPPYCQLKYVYYLLKPEVISKEYRTITVSFDPKNITGYGTPKIYQIQCKEKSTDWQTYVIKVMPDYSTTKEKDQNPITETIEGLKHGTLYQVRVLLLVASLDKYDGDLVPVSQTVTKCDIPEEYDYNVSAVKTSTSFSFSWTYAQGDPWCPVNTYEVSWKEDWNWLFEYSQGNFTLTDFLPGSTIEFRVRAVTSGGIAPFSKTMLVSTNYNGSSTVEDLQMVSPQSSAVQISWRPPVGSEDRPMQYRVSYKCESQPACLPGCVNISEGQLTQAGTSLTLSPLQPFTQYLVVVAPEDGLGISIHVGTTQAVPTEIPTVSDQKPIRTNTSLTVFWDNVPVCSSFLLGYNYQLIKASDSLKVLASGFTRDTTVSFHNLTASTEYVVKVFVTTVAGWNTEAFLAIDASTRAIVPEAVRNLTIYKRGRGMLGLRWAEPKTIYGKLKSFTVKHILGQEEVIHTIQPTSCIVWPELFCHTIEGLKSNRNYNVTVSARNADVEEDGHTSSVSGLTRESAPSAPENLKLSNSSSTSVELQWNYPSMSNGVLRSFLINVEEIEKHDSDNCCQIYPLVETPVHTEQQTYETEVSGLQPASTYLVSVTPKTVGLGPSQSLMVYTRPPHLPFSSCPSQVILVDKFLDSVDELTWLPQQQHSEVNNTDVYGSLVKAQLLLAALTEPQSTPESVDTGVQDPQLLSLLKQTISKPFFFVSEYNQEELLSESTWGQAPCLPAKHTRYQLIAVQVTDYSGLYNTDLRYSTPFEY